MYFFALLFDWPSLNFENVLLDIISIKHSDPTQAAELFLDLLHSEMTWM
jgi:hypothetical protein